ERRRSGDARAAGHIAPERQRELARRALDLRALGDVADRDEPDREVRDLEPDDALAGYGRLDPERPRREREGEVVTQRLDPRELDPGRGLELVPRDDRPDEDVDDPCRDAEMRERLFDDPLIAKELIFPRASGGSHIEEVHGG